jgi:hypothetical protein
MEWMKSTSTESSICKLVDGGVLPDATIEGWKPPIGESFLDPRPSELVVFEDFYWCGFGTPCHPFLRKLFDYYKVSLCNLHANSIMSISIFINLCEAYLGIHPHFNLWHHFFCLKKKGGSRGVQNSWRSVSASPGSHESALSECPSEHLDEGLVLQMVLRVAGAGIICCM